MIFSDQNFKEGGTFGISPQKIAIKRFLEILNMRLKWLVEDSKESPTKAWGWMGLRQNITLSLQPYCLAAKRRTILWWSCILLLSVGPLCNAFVCSETDRPRWNLTAINLEGELLPGTIWTFIASARLLILTRIFSAPRRMSSAMATVGSGSERGEHSLV